jgi:SAM-dependent methyltransferase
VRPWHEPELAIANREGLPFLVEHWYLGSRTRRYMMVRRFREVLEHADLAPGQRVLDLGCGWAYGSHWARERGCRVTGIDLGFDQLQWAARSLPAGLGLACANAKAMPFPDASFDRAVSSFMFHHLEDADRSQMLSEVRRVLKPGARLHLMDFVKADSHAGAHAWMRWLHSGPRLKDNSDARIRDLKPPAGRSTSAAQARGRSPCGIGRGSGRQHTRGHAMPSLLSAGIGQANLGCRTAIADHTTRCTPCRTVRAGVPG